MITIAKPFSSIILRTVVFGSVCALLSSCGVFKSVPQQADAELKPGERHLLFVSTYTDMGSEGIYSFSMDPKMIAADHVGTFKTNNPTAMVLDRERHVLYAASMTRQRPTITAAGIDRTSGELHLINSTPTLGALPSSIALANSAVVTTNYGNGSLTLVKTDDSGALGAPDWRIDLGKTQGSHPSSATFSPDGQTLMVTDMGLNRVMVFRASREVPPLSIERTYATLPNGVGPTDLLFSPKGDRVYVLGGRKPTIFLYRFVDRQLELLKEYALPAASSVHGRSMILSRDGEYLYVAYSSNQIIIYKVLQDGELQRMGVVVTPRSPLQMALSPDGRTLAVSCMESNKVVFYNRNKSNGALARMDIEIKVSHPASLVWMTYR